MFSTYSNVNKFFEEAFSDLKCHRDTKAYIVSIYDKFQSSENDLSKCSVTLLFAKAREEHDFATYQNLADWIFFSNTLYQEHLKNASKEYHDTVARLSYYSCYRLINKQWKLFEELADNFNYIESQVKNKLEIIRTF
jgi:hypothetical protein